MTDIKEKILASREERFKKTQFLKKDFKTVITVKTNIPGDNKNIKIAYTLVKLFKGLIPSSFEDKILFFDSYDGPYYLIGSNYDSKTIKHTLMTIEDNHSLGRFIDLDVYDGEKTLSRENPRLCFICNDIAFNCIRNKKHNLQDVINHVENKTLEYFQNEVSRIIDESILLELNLHPKFGLVTPNTSGSHKDMDYDLMFSAKESILPYLAKMFTIGWEYKLDEIFPKIRKIGLEAEVEMFKTTDSINAYKGLIFNLGILVAAYGYIFINHHDLENIFDVVKTISKDILKDFEKAQDTYGYFAYKEYNITGARGEVFNGIPNVSKALDILTDFSKESRLRALMFLISTTDDTVLLKRCKNIDQYYKIKRLFKKNINSDSNEIEKLDRYCINHNLSFGGSADLLILAIFLKKIGL